MHIELTPNQLDLLIDGLADLEPEDDNLRTDYSGRGMYGARCVGWVGDDPIRFAFELAAVVAIDPAAKGDVPLEDIREALEDIGSPRSDSMGLSTIWYWPNVSAVSADDHALR